MTHRFGLVLFAIGLLAAVISVVMGAVMLINGVPDAQGGAGVLFVLAAVCAGAGAGLRFVLGWRAKA